MARTAVRVVIGALISGSMVLSSTVAVAATTSVQQPSPWAVRAAMSGGAPAATICGAAAAAAQGAPGGCVLPALDAAPPPAVAEPAPVPPVAPPSAGLGISPVLLGLIALAAGIGIYLAVHNNGHGNSPA